MVLNMNALLKWHTSNKHLYPKNLYEDSDCTGSAIFSKANIESSFGLSHENRGNFTKQKSQKEENRKQKRLTQIELYFWDWNIKTQQNCVLQG